MVRIPWQMDIALLYLDFVFSRQQHDFDAILGMPCFRRLNLTIDWKRGSVSRRQVENMEQPKQSLGFETTPDKEKIATWSD